MEVQQKKLKQIVVDVGKEVTECNPTSQVKRIAKAFAELESKGYFTAMDHWCCQACGLADVPDGKEDKVVFYSHGDLSLAVEDPETMDEEDPEDFGYRLHLSWRGDAQEIIKALNDQGLETDWDGSTTTRIAILPANGVEDQEE